MRMGVIIILIDTYSRRRRWTKRRIGIIKVGHHGPIKGREVL